MDSTNILLIYVMNTKVMQVRTHCYDEGNLPVCNVYQGQIIYTLTLLLIFFTLRSVDCARQIVVTNWFFWDISQIMM